MGTARPGTSGEPHPTLFRFLSLTHSPSPAPLNFSGKRGWGGGQLRAKFPPPPRALAREGGLCGQL